MVEIYKHFTSTMQNSRVQQLVHIISKSSTESDRAEDQMATKLLTKFLDSNAKFAQNYAAPPPLMKMRENWAKTGGKGTVICMENSSCGFLSDEE